MEQRDFFISYNKRDVAKALWIADTLNAHGYSVYIQARDIGPGDNFVEKMNAFFKNSRNFIAVWSHHYSASRFCTTELQAAFNEWHQGRMDCLLPVRIEDHPMEPLYAALVHAELFGITEAEKEKRLLDAVRYAMQSRSPTSNETVTSEQKPPETASQKSALKESDNGDNKISREGLPRSVIIILLLACVSVAVWAGKTMLHNRTFPTSKNEEIVGVVEEIDVDDLVRLGDSYLNGDGENIDYTRARGFYESAQEKGSAEALGKLGFLYSYGLEVDVDYTKAREYFEQAAEKGNANALYRLGWLYENGFGVEQDYDKAREYYEQGVEKGDADALSGLGWLYYKGYGMDEDDDLAWTYTEQAIEKGSVYALNNMGYFYQYGGNWDRNFVEAKNYYEQAAEKGNANALNNLGCLYDYGYGVPQNYNTARKYYEQAAEKGFLTAMFNLGEMYQNGHGVDIDYTIAREYYEQAAERESKYAFYTLGTFYEKGLGVKAVDYAIALEYYQKAADKGSKPAPAKVEEMKQKLNQ